SDHADIAVARRQQRSSDRENTENHRYPTPGIRGFPLFEELLAVAASRAVHANDANEPGAPLLHLIDLCHQRINALLRRALELGDRRLELLLALAVLLGAFVLDLAERLVPLDHEGIDALGACSALAPISCARASIAESRSSAAWSCCWRASVTSDSA